MRSKWNGAADDSRVTWLRVKIEGQLRSRGLGSRDAARAAGIEHVVMERFLAGIKNGVPDWAYDRLEDYSGRLGVPPLARLHAQG